MTADDYWDEAVRCAFNEFDLVATEEQIKGIAGEMSASHEMYGEATGQHVFSANLRAAQEKEAPKIQAELQWEREKTVCSHCNGKGGWTVPCGTAHQAWQECTHCNGKGKLNYRTPQDYLRLLSQGEG